MATENKGNFAEDRDKARTAGNEGNDKSHGVGKNN